VANPHVLPGGWRAPARDLNRLRQSFNGRGRVPPEDLVPSRSDRLRGDLIRASTSEPDLIMTPPRREPQPPAQSDGVPFRGADLRDVIDWLLKERR
jgi:hypothetical protein